MTGGYEAAKTLLARKDLPDCMFASNDVMAVGAMAALQAAGVRPGTDVGVAGFDDIATLRDVTPPLTTVRVPLYDIGIDAMERVLGDQPDRISKVGCEVVLRASTGVPALGRPSRSRHGGRSR